MILNKPVFLRLAFIPIGLKHEAVLAKNAGRAETKGDTKLRLPKQPIITTVAYGVQVNIHRQTFVIATLAILTSALSPWFACEREFLQGYILTIIL